MVFLLSLDKARVKGHWRTLEAGPVWVSNYQRRGEAQARPTGSQLGLFGNAPTPQLNMFGGPGPSEHTTQPRPLLHEPAHAQAQPEPEPEPEPTPKTAADIPQHVKDRVSFHANRVHQFNAEIGRLRDLGQRFGAPGRYEYEYRSEHEPTFDHDLERLAYIEGLAQQQGIDKNALYAHIDEGIPVKKPWSEEALAWHRPPPEPTPPVVPEEPQPAMQYRPLTEDAIHNWDVPYIQKQYAELPDEIRQAAQQAMRRHHQKGTDAREEAQAINAQFGLTEGGKPEPARQAEPGKEPWQMTRAEFRTQENTPKVQAIKDAIRAGKQIMVATQLRGTILTSPEHIRMTSAGHVQTRERTTWVNLTDEHVDKLATQAGYAVPDIMDKVYHHAEVAQALKDGKPVPAHVLAEYPDLQQPAEDDEPEPEPEPTPEPESEPEPQPEPTRQARARKPKDAEETYPLRPGSLFSFTSKEIDQIVALVRERQTSSEHPTIRMSPQVKRYALGYGIVEQPEGKKRLEYGPTWRFSAQHDLPPEALWRMVEPMLDGQNSRGASITRDRRWLQFDLYPAGHPAHTEESEQAAVEEQAGILSKLALHNYVYFNRGGSVWEVSRHESQRPKPIHKSRLVISLDKARVRGHWRVLESGPAYVHGYQRREQPGQHIAEPRNQLRLFGDVEARRPQLVLLHPEPQTQPTPEPPPPEPVAMPPETGGPPTYRSLVLALQRAQNLPVRSIHMRNAGDVAAMFEHFRNGEREKLMAIHVDADNTVVNVECVSVGGLTESIANVREVLKGAVVQGTPGLWLLHNHPSGDPTPSKADYDVTRLVRNYGQRLGITLHGHIVIGETHYSHITNEEGVAQHWPYAPVTGEAEDAVPEITLSQHRLPEPMLQGKQIRSAQDAANLGKDLMHGTAQQSYLLVLDQKNQINAAVPVPTTGTGSDRQAALNEALRQAILHNGRNCILVSDVDNQPAFRAFVQAYKDTLQGTPITMLDGIQLLDKGYASMAEQGLLKALVLSLDKARRLHGRRKVSRLQISIENRKGSIRRGVDHAGTPWETKLPASYGYIRGTTGLDDAQVDVFVRGAHPEACPVFVVTTMCPPDFTDTDEQKAFLGWSHIDDVKKTFGAMYKDPRHMGAIIEMSFQDFQGKVLATGKEPGAVQAVG